jgi:uncharacterized protein YukJ
MPKYCMYKGIVRRAAPFFDSYGPKPHYVIRAQAGDSQDFDIVVNSASAVAIHGDVRVYAYLDLNFQDPIIAKLDALALGYYESGFPRLDYFQDASLLDLTKFRLVPAHDEDGSRFDINDDIDDLLTIDETNADVTLEAFNSGERKFWKPLEDKVIVYGFGFAFAPGGGGGLHETHMNQGNPKQGGHAQENGAFHDGAVIVQRGSNFQAIFTAFQSQYLPTQQNGYPAPVAVPFAQYINR